MISALSSELPKGSTGKVALPPPPQAPFCILHSEFWAELLPKRAAICNLHPAFCVLSVSQRFKALERGRGNTHHILHSPFCITLPRRRPWHELNRCNGRAYALPSSRFDVLTQLPSPSIRLRPDKRAVASLYHASMRRWQGGLLTRIRCEPCSCR